MVADAVAPGYLVGGQYRLVALIGSGGFGRVWKAVDESLNVEVALKQVWLPPSLSAGQRADALRRATREARNAARLRDHPNIVTVHSVVIDGDSPWIVMRWVDGLSLDQSIRERGALALDDVRRIAAGLLDALGAAHAAGILHRDVKPANVLLSSTGEVLLADFGIAIDPAETAVTATGTFIGSAEYMAPERLRGSDTPASDLFSLGATLYHAIEGVSPFHRGAAAETITAVLFDEPPAPRRAGELEPLILGLLTKDPAYRLSIEQARRTISTPPTRTQPYDDPPPTRPQSYDGPPTRPQPYDGPPATRPLPEPSAAKPLTGKMVAWSVLFAAVGIIAGAVLFIGPKQALASLGREAPASAPDLAGAGPQDCAGKRDGEYRKVPCWYQSARYEVVSVSPVPLTAKNKNQLSDADKSAACTRLISKKTVIGWGAVKRDGSWAVYCMGSR
jgi:serine/threonine protein kinase